MEAFAADTGLTDAAREPRRYLWTDAFAVCNFLELHRQTGEQAYLDLALRLVDQVHEVLGRHHPESGREGWLSGLDDEEAKKHPTLGGLRIGKKHNERQPDEPYDAALEWDRDGQYFHYLTKWMHALNAVARETGNGLFHHWARELARVAHAAFTYVMADGDRRMYWKMSADLSRPLVLSMGQHDPLDGWLTFTELQATGLRFGEWARPSLTTEIVEMAGMCAGQRWTTTDSLGIGGLLSDAWRLTQLVSRHHLPESDRLAALMEDIDISVQGFLQQNTLNYPIEYRLAFRELGMSIGLHGLEKMVRQFDSAPESFEDVARLRDLASRLLRYSPMRGMIEAYWLDSEHQRSPGWRDHEDINRVMLATTLAPDSFLRV